MFELHFDTRRLFSHSAHLKSEFNLSSDKHEFMTSQPVWIPIMVQNATCISAVSTETRASSAKTLRMDFTVKEETSSHPVVKLLKQNCFAYS